MKTITLTPEQVGVFNGLAAWHANEARNIHLEIATSQPSLGRSNELRKQAARHDSAAKHIKDMLAS